MSVFLILPHQLFDIKHLNIANNYIIWEHPHYFLDYNYNKKKLLMHYGSMHYYFEYLQSHKFNVEYYTYNTTPDINNYQLFDPIDKINLPGKYTIIESPNFILNCNIYAKYRKKTDKFFFKNFYMFGKKEINVMPDVKSTDKENRKSLPKNILIPKLTTNANDEKYIDIGATNVNKHFKNNYGNTNNFIFPLTHETANNWLDDFIKSKIKQFGDYQDAIDKNEHYLFHSVLSTVINIGLLNPSDIISKIMAVAAAIPINSLEGYIRQLFWREYQRYCYIYCDFRKNYFGNNKKLTKKWYSGKLGIGPVDDCIITGFDTGYLDHIKRLMVVGNYMNLANISPKEGHKWFMEFSCDSYEWVMAQNVYDMVFFVTGGKTMRRPYMSSSNYILKMSNYKKGEWSNIWDDKYHEFLKKNKDKLWNFRYYFKNLDKR